MIVFFYILLVIFLLLCIVAVFCDSDSGSEEHGVGSFVWRRRRRFAIWNVDSRGFKAFYRISGWFFSSLLSGSFSMVRATWPIRCLGFDAAE